MRVAATSSAGPEHHPIFQPVNENDLPTLEIVSVRSAIPGSVAGRDVLAVEDEMLVDLVADADQVVLDATPAISSSSAATAPVPSGCAAS